KFPQAQRNVRVRTKQDLKELSCAPKIDEIEALLGNAGRTLFRYSGTEPLLRILIEGKDEAQINEWADLLVELISDEIGA
ncbi:MAG: phosphoglucosamine mutase, partial [Verrucomicrobiota bacterium]